MKHSKMTGAVIAAAAAALFASGTVAPAPAHAAGVKCVGANSCKGRSACKTGSSACKGLNACKGQGWISAASAKACLRAGGRPA